MTVIKQFNTELPAHFEANRTQVNVGITPATKIVEEVEVSGYEYFTACFEHPEMYTDDALFEIAKKEVRSYEVDHIIVTIGDYVIDGDETAQARMIRAAQSMSDTDTISWKDANNNFVSLNKAVLLEAVLMAGKAQTELWIKYA